MLVATARNYRMDKACAEVKKKETETQGPLSDEQRHNIFQTTYKGTLQCKSSQPRGYGYMAKPSTRSERIRIQIEEQARATAAFQQRNCKLNHQVNDLQDRLQAERANTQEIINLEGAEREQLEGKLKEEFAERERLLEAEQTSRLKFEKNMMAKFVEFSKQMGTQQVFTNRIDKENSNPNFQKTLLHRPSPNKAAGSPPLMVNGTTLTLEHVMQRLDAIENKIATIELIEELDRKIHNQITQYGSKVGMVLKNLREKEPIVNDSSRIGKLEDVITNVGSAFAVVQNTPNLTIKKTVKFVFVPKASGESSNKDEELKMINDHTTYGLSIKDDYT
ncbi:hypothetical protein D1007_39941 [Hordeum vulgare]|nr:hypothetical protein D1007_39941 [Hordeum vulgare]